MGKKDKDKKREKKHKKEKKKKDKKRRLEYDSHSDSERESHSKRSKYDDDPSRKEKKDKKRRKKSKDYSSSSSSSSSDSDLDRKHKKSKSKDKEPKEPVLNTALLGTTISSRDYESVRMKFKSWLEEENIGTLNDIEAKNDLLMQHYGQFSKLWNEGTLSANYYHKAEGEPQSRPTVVARPTKTMGPAAAEPTADDNKYTLKGDGGLSDRYLTGSREVLWIHKRMDQERKSHEKRQTKLNAKAEAYQEKEREKMEDFKKVMGLA